MLYQNRKDVLEFLNQFDHKEMYLFIRNRLGEITDEGDHEDGLTDEAMFDEVIKEASNKYPIDSDEIVKEYDKIDSEVKEFMLLNR